MSLIDREALIAEYDRVHVGAPGGARKLMVDAPEVRPEPRWIPCNERLPEEDVNVLVSYRYKEGEGDTSHSNIAITSYGQMYFGGHKVGIHHWRAPFKYFHNNYEVIAWMPLPEPYREDEQDE